MMAEPPSLEELARRYMDLWEEQLTAVAGDQALADQMGQLFAAMKQGVGSPASGDAGADKTDEATDDAGGQPTGAPGAETAPGTEAFGAASERSDGDMAEFARRLADVEKRLAALERDIARKSTRTASKGGAKRGK